MSGTEITALIALVLCLILAVRNLRAQDLPGRTQVWMAAVWLAIIAVTALVAGRLSA